MTNIKTNVTALEAAIAELTERAQRSAEQLERVTARAEQLERRLARGTTDHGHDLLTAEWSPIPTRPDLEPAPARRARRSVAPPPVVTRDLGAELEAALRAKPSSMSELARVLRVPTNSVAGLMRPLKKSGNVYNIGSSDAPLWTWVIGDETPTPELNALVGRLLRVRPLAWKELLAATGARRTRLSAAVTALQRGGIEVENRGDPRRARWFIPR